MRHPSCLDVTDPSLCAPRPGAQDDRGAKRPGNSGVASIAPPPRAALVLQQRSLARTTAGPRVHARQGAQSASRVLAVHQQGAHQDGVHSALG